ncbi:metallophosphoesterase [Candidatus Poribacteria bacterium]
MSEYGEDRQLLATIEELLSGHEEEKFISLLENLVIHRFGADTDKEKRELLQYLTARIRDKDEHLKNEESYRRLRELLCNYHLPGRAVEDVKGIRNIEELSHYGAVVFLPAGGTLYIVGDTHGDPVSVERIVSEINFRERADDAYLVFLGDYANNGLNSIDNLIALLSLEEEFPDRVVLLGGNHESRESYLAALNEYFIVHWNNAKENLFLDKYPPNHYGHLRLELITRFGVEKGEEIYDLFGEWGKRLPYIAFSAKGVMMSHSIGLPSESMGETLDLERLAYAKRRSEAFYHRMVSNRDSLPSFLGRFTADLGVDVFVVGHSHYRSGDVEENGRLVTICSSDKKSPEAGHYMENEFRWERLAGKGAKEGRKGRADAYYVMFSDETVTKIDKEVNLCLIDQTTYVRTGCPRSQALKRDSRRRCK